MKRVTKLFCGFMAVLVLVSSISLPANAEMLEQHTYKGFVYEVWGKDEVYINDYIGKKTKLVIPETIKGKKVVGVGSKEV